VVLDLRTHAGFDLLRDLVVPAGKIDPVALRGVFEFRALIGPEIARLAALRIDAPALGKLAAIVDEIEACAPDDGAALLTLDFRFHYLMARASESLPLLLILNSVKELYLRDAAFFAAIVDPAQAAERARYRVILEALGAHDAARAERVCAALIADSNRRFLGRFGAEEI
jgi:DNA-binding FadR family transcriptional regulator